MFCNDCVTRVLITVIPCSSNACWSIRDTQCRYSFKFNRDLNRDKDTYYRGLYRITKSKYLMTQLAYHKKTCNSKEGGLVEKKVTLVLLSIFVAF